MQKYICKAVGCGRTIDKKGYCPLHQYKQRQDDERKLRWQLKNAPEHEWTSLYNSARWRREREQYLKENPSCVYCGKDAEVVDHRIAHRGEKELFWDHDNWQSLCKDCHTKKTWAEIRERAQKTKQDRTKAW